VILPMEPARRLEDAGWKRKEEVGEFQLRDWAHTRYHCIQGARRHLGLNGCPICEPPQWHYRVDGVAPDSPDAMLAWDMQTRGEYWEVSPDGLCIPSMPVGEFNNYRPTIIEHDRIPIGETI
jgi:hypothetical protein